MGNEPHNQIEEFLTNLIPELPTYDKISYTTGNKCINICRLATWARTKHKINLYIAYIYYCINHPLNGENEYYLSLRSNTNGLILGDYYIRDPESLTNLKSAILQFLHGYNNPEPPQIPIS